jgi:predicted secreted protein
MSMIGTPIYVGKTAEFYYIGAGGTNIFRFRAEKEGQVTLQFDYRRPWEATVPPAKTLRYDVVVQ